MKPIKLSALIEALEFELEDYVTKVDVHNGCVVTLEQSLLDAIEAGEEDPLDGTETSTDAEMEIAREVVNDTGGRFVDTPDKWDFHEYRQMQRFIGTIENSDHSEQLWRAIKGKGAFRYFKDTADRLGVLDAWYRYRDRAIKEFVIEWAEFREIAFTDDVPSTRDA
jgi:hypothetical protein